jgi:hypothetical protein
VKDCGVAMARLPEHSRVPNWPIGHEVNVGTACGRLVTRASSAGTGQARCRLKAAGGAEAP